MFETLTRHLGRTWQFALNPFVAHPKGAGMLDALKNLSMTRN
jgi:hypothetical protein